MTPKEVFLAACAAVGWTIADESSALIDLAEHLFAHAERGSDPWAVVMSPVRDAREIAEAGGAVDSVAASLSIASQRATARGIALPA